MRTRRRLHRRALLALLAVFAIVVAACGSSGDDTATAASDKGLTGTKDEVKDALNTTTTASGASTTAAPSAKPTSIEEWEALWATEREAIVKTTTDNGWGWDQTANKVTGPGGFSVDLSTCPAGWDPNGGLENGVINIGQTIAQSGTLADYGNIGVAQQILYDYVNSTGGIKDSTGKTYTISDGSPGRLLRSGQDRAAGRRAARLGRFIRHPDAGLAEHHEGVRQDQPALRARPLRDVGSPGVG